LRPKKFNNKGKQKTIATIQQDLGSDLGDETKITTMGMKYVDSNASTSSSSKSIESQNDKERNELFHIRVITKHTKVYTLFDSGSQFNIVSETNVKKLNLETTPHEKPCPLGCICDDSKLQVKRKCKFKFSITDNFIDDVELYVVPLQIWGIILGSPYLYDQKSIFYHHENKYHILKDQVVHIVRSCHKKMNLSLVSAGQMKRLVNAGKKFVLWMIKAKDIVEFEAFSGCDSKLKHELVEVVNTYDKTFRDPKELPPKRGIRCYETSSRKDRKDRSTP